jgi:16S rRNA (guanine527-N7)-methyltransferase
MKQLPAEPLKLIENYADIVFKWNSKINLTSYTRKEFFDTGIFDCSVLLCILDSLEIREIADIGTGYGMPGMALKILKPDLTVHLIDASEKKIAFLEYAGKILNLNVGIHLRKLPDSSWKRQFGCIVSKASMKEDNLLKTAYGMLPEKGRLIYFAGLEPPVSSPRFRFLGNVFYQRPNKTFSRITMREKACT